MDHERIIHGIISTLEATVHLAETAHLTGAMKGGVRRAIQQYDAALVYLTKNGMLDEGFFPPLEPDSGFDDVGVACSQLSSFMRGYFGIDRKRRDEERVDINSLIREVANRQANIAPTTEEASRVLPGDEAAK